MTILAVVKEWHDEGWGVLESQETPGGCWAHFSKAAVPGFASFSPGQSVWLDWESPGQDGYTFRAVRFWPEGSDPAHRPSTADGGAYHSSLTLSFDDQPEDKR
jgi:CspA family cold shock protein